MHFPLLVLVHMMPNYMMKHRVLDQVRWNGAEQRSQRGGTPSVRTMFGAE